LKFPIDPSSALKTLFITLMGLSSFLPFFVLLANLAPLAHGKGGGKSSSSKTSSSGSRIGGTTSHRIGGVTVVKSGSTTVCYNTSGDRVRCPLTKEDVIIIIVVSSLIGCVLLVGFTYWVVKCIKDKRGQREKKRFTLPSLSFGKREQKYKALDDQSDLVEHV